jgi:hypothetical protein
MFVTRENMVRRLSKGIARGCPEMDGRQALSRLDFGCNQVGLRNPNGMRKSSSHAGRVDPFNRHLQIIERK